MREGVTERLIAAERKKLDDMRISHRRKARRREPETPLKPNWASSGRKKT